MVSRKFHAKSERPVWEGTLLDRYYYIVKNKKYPKMSAWLVRFTDDPNYKDHVLQITSGNKGELSLIESDISLLEDPKCKRLALTDVERIKTKLFDSHPQKAKVILDENGERHLIPPVPFDEEEVFG